MVKKCIYCSVGIEAGSVVDMCEGCMYQVWGEKMAKAIVAGMERERDVGNLDLGRVGETPVKAMDVIEVSSDVVIEEVSVEELGAGVEKVGEDSLFFEKGFSSETL